MLIFFFQNSNRFLEINVILLELNQSVKSQKKSCCFATTSQIIVHACKIAFATSKFNGEMVKNKDRVDNQTCTVVENRQEKSQF